MAGAKKKKKKPLGGLNGKPPMSEPRVQLYSMFGGCNFQLSPRDFSYVHNESEEPGTEQTDQMPNMMVIQNNAELTTNKTIATRQNLDKLFVPPVGKKFTGVNTLIGDDMYAALDDNTVRYAAIPSSGPTIMTSMIDTNDRETAGDKTWTFLGYADDKLVGINAAKQIWTGSLASHTLENARTVPSPSSALAYSQLTAKGKLTISSTWNSTNPFRVGLCYTRVNMYGPTTPSAMLTFYASKPTSEWSGAAYVRIKGTVPSGYDILAVELYYVEGEYAEPAFLSRVNLADDENEDTASVKNWSYNWKGYQFDTTMWAIANLAVPTQNFTSGAPASRMAVHDGQLYFWGGSPAHRIWIGGNPGNRFSVSPGTGGGFVDCEPGVGTAVRNVLKFKTTQGAAIVTALCDNENSQREHRFNLVENNISISQEQSVKGWQAEKIAGTVGCKSYRGAVVADDGLYTVSRYGLAITTHTMEYNSQLQVQYVSDAIEPVFLKQYGSQLASSVLFTVAGVVYMTFGSGDSTLDNVIFCYDSFTKAWWTYTIDVDKPILNMMHIDHQSRREGIGIVTEDAIYLLPTTRMEDISVRPEHEVLIESAELSGMMPLQSMIHLTQLEFRFDYFIGDMDIVVTMIDQFGRTIKVEKRVHHDEVRHHLSEYLRIDKTIESYKVVLKGKANMRLTHFLAKTYPKSNRIGTVYGFDTRQSSTSSGSIHRTFDNYNDLREAIIP